VIDGRTTAIRHGDAVEAIDLTDGTTGPVDPAEALGCSSELVEFDYARAYPGPKGPVKKRIGGTLAFACDPQLEPIDGPLEARIAEAMGIAIGTMAVVGPRATSSDSRPAEAAPRPELWADVGSLHPLKPPSA
jgi:hypothetical protein